MPWDMQCRMPFCLSSLHQPTAGTNAALLPCRRPLLIAMHHRHSPMRSTHIDEQEDIWPDALLLNGLSLGGAAGVAIQQPAAGLHVALGQAGLHHLHHHLIRHLQQGSE